MKAQFCIHYPLNPKKCIELREHMALDDDISDEEVPKIKNEVLSKHGPETEEFF